MTDSARNRGGFKVQRRRCATCIYRKDSSLDLKALEDAVRDKYMGFRGHRICHHSKDACCRGFWDNHKDEFALGQIAQRLNMVAFVDEGHPEMTGEDSARNPRDLHMGRPAQLRGEARIKADEVSARLKDLLDERTRRKLEGRWT